MKTNQKINKIFISHSVLDRDFAECLIRLLTDMKVPDNMIFCSSISGYGIPLGEDFLTYIKNSLNDDVLVLFILTDNFYHSKICLCEMGATWVRTSIHVPIVVPPFKFQDIKGVIVGIQSMEINNREAINELKSKLSKLLNLEEIHQNIWERRRDDYLHKINDLIDKWSLNNSTQNYTKVSDNEIKINYKKYVLKILRNSKNILNTNEIFEIMEKNYDIQHNGMDIDDIYDILSELEDQKKIRSIRFDGATMEQIPWVQVI